MAQAGKYGEVGIEHIPDDEPVFVIRAQDKLAVPIINTYIDMAHREGAETDFVLHLAVVRDDVIFWQRSHETKTPD